MTHQEPYVLISGGGPSGLLASILLNNIGVSSVVLERAKEPDEWSSKSYTLVLGDRGMSSLRQGRCLEDVQTAGTERRFVYFYDGKTGEVKAMPKKSPGIGLTRPLVVECLEKIAHECPRIQLKRGVGLSSVSKESGGVQAQLEDGTTISATHIIGSDGKWSRVRESFPSLRSQAKHITSPSFGVAMNSPTVPKGFKSDGTYVINPSKECMFYVIVSPLPSGKEFSISMVCYDETLERYPWLAPPADMKPGEYGKGGWEDEFSAVPEAIASGNDLSEKLQTLFQEEMPEFYECLDKEAFRSARVNRRTAWLQMSAADGEDISYSSPDGLATLIGDAAHAMTPSMGEGCNCALESAVKLADSVTAAMKKNGESTCSVASLSEGFIQYGLARPQDCIPIQEASAARNIFNKGVKKTTPTSKDPFLHSKTAKSTQ